MAAQCQLDRTLELPCRGVYHYDFLVRRHLNRCSKYLQSVNSRRWQIRDRVLLSHLNKYSKGWHKHEPSKRHKRHSCLLLKQLARPLRTAESITFLSLVRQMQGLLKVPCIRLYVNPSSHSSGKSRSE